MSKKYFITDVSMHECIQMELRAQICSLGGELQINDCTDESTHLICTQNKAIPSQRVMCGLLYGLKTVSLTYIMDSYRKGYWLKERNYCQIKGMPLSINNMNRKMFNKKIFLHSHNKLRIIGFKRVLIAGSADICEKDDVLHGIKIPDFCLCDHIAYQQALEIVPPNTPILSYNYVRDCIFYNHNPSNLKKFLLKKRVLPGLSSTSTSPAKINQKRIRIQKPVLSQHSMNDDDDDYLKIVYENVYPNSVKPMSRSSSVEIIEVSTICNSEESLQYKELLSLITTWNNLIKNSHYLLNGARYFGSASSSHNECNILSQSDMVLCNVALDFKKCSLKSVKVGRFKKMCMEYRDDFSPEAAVLIGHGFSWTNLRISPVTLPNSSFVAKQLVAFIFQASSRQFLESVLFMFEKIVRLHPPSCKRIRQYYLDVFIEASKLVRNDDENGRPWSFFSKLLSEEISNPKEECLQVSSSPLEYFVAVLDYDMYYFNQSPGRLTSLLCYQLFWECTDNPSIQNKVVKEIISLFCQSAHSSQSIRESIAHLLSIMMELIFKWRSLSVPQDLCQWPLNNKWTSVSSEILHQFKVHEKVTDILPGIRLISVPWQKMFLYFLFYRAYRPNITLGTIGLSALMSLLTTAVNNCPEESVESHLFHLDLLSTMITAYLEGIGLMYLRINKSSQLNIPLIKREFDHLGGGSQMDEINFKNLTQEYDKAGQIENYIHNLCSSSPIQCCHLKEIMFAKGF